MDQIMQYEYPFDDGFSFGALIPTAEDLTTAAVAGGTAAAAMVVVPLVLGKMLGNTGWQGWVKSLAPAVIGIVGGQAIKQFNPVAGTALMAVGAGLTVMSLVSKLTGGTTVKDPLSALPDEEQLVGLLNGLEQLQLMEGDEDYGWSPEELGAAEDEGISEGESVEFDSRQIAGAGAEIEERTIAGIIGTI